MVSFVSKFNVKGAGVLIYWAMGLTILIVALIPYYLWLGLFQLSADVRSLAFLVYIIVVPYIIGRIAVRLVATQIFSEKLRAGTKATT
jgi:hypothetical protein